MNKFLYILAFTRSVMILLIISNMLFAQQVGDISFNPDIDNPAYSAGNGPVVSIDEAHNNFHTVTGRYRAFADILRKDGYVVKGLKSSFTHDILQKMDIVVIANALNKINVDNRILPTPSAFTESEIEITENWIINGGSLLLIADHMPWPGATEKLAQKFGFIMGNGFAFVGEDATGLIKFRLDDGSLTNHPIVKGRIKSETVEFVTTFTGQAFRLAPDCAAEPLMILGKGSILLLPVKAWDFSQKTPYIIAEGMLQGATIKYGKGRVAMFGEAAMFTAQATGSEKLPMGMNHPEAKHNCQFMLNVLHWLSGLLPDQ